jgi:hypothetical protein
LGISFNKLFISDLLEQLFLNFSFKLRVFVMMQIDHRKVITMQVLVRKLVEGKNGLFDNVEDLFAMEVEGLVVEEDFGEEVVVLVEGEVLREMGEAGFEDVGEYGSVVLAAGDLGDECVEEGLHGCGSELGARLIELLDQVIVVSIIIGQGDAFLNPRPLGEPGPQYKIEHQYPSQSTKIEQKNNYNNKDAERLNSKVIRIGQYQPQGFRPFRLRRSAGKTQGRLQSSGGTQSDKEENC